MRGWWLGWPIWDIVSSASRSRRGGARVFVDISGQLGQEVVSVDKVLLCSKRRKRVLRLAGWRGRDRRRMVAVKIDILSASSRNVLQGGKPLSHSTVVNRLDLVSFGIIKELIHAFISALLALVDGRRLVHVRLRGRLVRIIVHRRSAGGCTLIRIIRTHAC